MAATSAAAAPHCGRVKRNQKNVVLFTFFSPLFFCFCFFFFCFFCILFIMIWFVCLFVFYFFFLRLFFLLIFRTVPNCTIFFSCTNTHTQTLIHSCTFPYTLTVGQKHIKYGINSQGCNLNLKHVSRPNFHDFFEFCCVLKLNFSCCCCRSRCGPVGSVLAC